MREGRKPRSGAVRSIVMDVVARGFGLPEAPWYDVDRAEFYIADAVAGGVWRLPLDGGEREAVVPHRRGIAGLAAHAEGGFVVGGRNLSWKREEDTVVLADVELSGTNVRFNDLTTSAAGRVYVGSMELNLDGSPPSQLGNLVMVDLDGTVRPVAREVALTNGLAFSPDEARLYHVDSGPRNVRQYDVNTDGSLSDWNELHRWPVGIPDGMAVAADGSLWVALADVDGRGFVSVLDPTGDERDRIEMPHPGVKSLCFGGDDLRTLFVALGGSFDPDKRDGFVVSLGVDVPGVPRAPARVALDGRGEQGREPPRP
jgi:gluconolactonase